MCNNMLVFWTILVCLVLVECRGLDQSYLSWYRSGKTLQLDMYDFGFLPMRKEADRIKEQNKGCV